MRAIAPLEAATLPVDEVLARLDTSADGLASFEVERRRSRCGPNVVLEHRVSAFAVLLRQLRNPLLILLVGAAGVSIATGDVTGGSIIVAIVALSVLLGFVNEFHTEQTVLALHANVQHTTLAWRDGAQRRIPTAELVVGDLVDLRMGDVIPADVRLVEVNGLLCDESILTGEATPAEKSTDAVASPASELDLPDCAFMGTIVHRGAGRAVVVTTGAGTAFGGIAAGLGEPQATTAFQRGLKSFSKMLVRVAAVLTIGIFVANIALSKPLLDALLFSLAIAIGITPQLLPAIVSVSLSAGSRRLAKRQVLVKRLVTIEDLADVAIVFTDKTGTLTEGAIRFERALDPRGARRPRASRAGTRVQRGDEESRRYLERQRPGCRAPDRGGRVRRAPRIGSTRGPATGDPAIRPPTSTLVGAGARRVGRCLPRHEGCARSGPGALHRCRPGGTRDRRQAVRTGGTRRRGGHTDPARSVVVQR